MITIDGKNYVKIGDKLVEVDHLDKAGQPVIKTWSEEIQNAKGGTDCIIHVECLQIAGAENS